MKKAFMNHATDDVLDQVRAGVPTNQISHNLSLSYLKPLVVDWMLEAYEHLKELSPVVLEAYTKTGIANAWDDKFQVWCLCLQCVLMYCVFLMNVLVQFIYGGT